jgi:amino acid transporter
MTLPLTIAIAAALLAVAVFAGWRGARPPNLMKGPRMMPWRAIMVTAAAFLLIVLVHLVNLLGVKTGR